MNQVVYRNSAKLYEKGQQSTCEHHQQPFTYFCETCEEPVCQLCTTMGSHNYQLHRISKLHDAFTQRVYKFQHEIKSSLLEKRQAMLEQTDRLEFRMVEIGHIASLIEQDARAEMTDIADRLTNQDTSKQAILRHESLEIQKDLNEINALVIEFNEATNDVQDQMAFLMHNKSLHERIEFIIAKPTKKGIDIIADDLPQELTDLRLEMGKVSAQKNTLIMLNEIIWHLMNEHKQETEAQKSIMEEHAKVEIKEWVKLVDHFTEQLKEQQMICYFCHASLQASTVNKKCKENVIIPSDIKVGYTKEKPIDQHLGNSRHFWGHPTEELGLKELLLDQQKKTPNAVLVETILTKLKRRTVEHKVDFKKVIQEHQKDCLINHIHFAFILSDMLNLTSDEIQNLIFFLDDENKGEIVVSDLFTCMASQEHVKQRAAVLVTKYAPKKILKKKKK